MALSQAVGQPGPGTKNAEHPIFFSFKATVITAVGR